MVLHKSFYSELIIQNKPPLTKLSRTKMNDRQKEG